MDTVTNELIVYNNFNVIRVSNLLTSFCKFFYHQCNSFRVGSGILSQLRYHITEWMKYLYILVRIIYCKLLLFLTMKPQNVWTKLITSVCQIIQIFSCSNIHLLCGTLLWCKYIKLHSTKIQNISLEIFKHILMIH